MGYPLVLTVLVTGANGFIGSHLVPFLREKGYNVKACVRKASHDNEISIGDLATFNGWDELLQDVDVVIHLAGRAHQVNDTADDPKAAFTAANVTATQRLITACEAHHIKQCIFMSTIAVMGYHSGNTAFTEEDVNPYNDYSETKFQAEQLFKQSSLNWTICRVPLVYGAGVRANFHALMEAVNKKAPLPFGRVTNRRSILYVGNLVEALYAIIGRHDLQGQTLLIADKEVVSSAELIRRIADALEVKPKLVSVPVWLLKLGAYMLRKKILYHKLCGNLEMDTTHSFKEMHWQPPYTMQDGLRETALWFKKER